MGVFDQLKSNNISYNTDILQVDGAFTVNHTNYDKSPKFDGIKGTDIINGLTEDKFLKETSIEDVLGYFEDLKGTISLGKDDIISLWYAYWKEYMHAFNILTETHPESVVTAFTARHAVEIGFKYLLAKKNQLSKTHDLSELCKKLLQVYKINVNSDDRYSYLKWINEFCASYTDYIEDRNPEYFRYPQYKYGSFGGERLDIRWLSYNWALILLKLEHFNETEAI